VEPCHAERATLKIGCTLGRVLSGMPGCPRDACDVRAVCHQRAGKRGCAVGFGRFVARAAALLVDHEAGWGRFLARVAVGREDYSTLPMCDTLWYHASRALWS